MLKRHVKCQISHRSKRVTRRRMPDVVARARVPRLATARASTRATARAMSRAPDAPWTTKDVLATLGDAMTRGRVESRRGDADARNAIQRAAIARVCDADRARVPTDAIDALAAGARRTTRRRRRTRDGRRCASATTSRCDDCWRAKGRSIARSRTRRERAKARTARAESRRRG